MEHLWGLTHIEEQILDLKLDIDPNFYFQVLTTVVLQLFIYNLMSIYTYNPLDLDETGLFKV